MDMITCGCGNKYPKHQHEGGYCHNCGSVLGEKAKQEALAKAKILMAQQEITKEEVSIINNDEELSDLDIWSQYGSYDSVKIEPEIKYVRKLNYYVIIKWIIIFVGIFYYLVDNYIVSTPTGINPETNESYPKPYALVMIISIFTTLIVMLFDMNFSFSNFGNTIYKTIEKEVSKVLPTEEWEILIKSDEINYWEKYFETARKNQLLEKEIDALKFDPVNNLAKELQETN